MASEMNDDIFNQPLARWQAILDAHAATTAVFSPSGESLRTFSDLAREADDFSTRFLDFPPGSVVGICLPNRMEWPALYLAGLKRSLILLPMDASLGRDASRDVLAVSGAAGHIIIRDGKLESLRFSHSPVAWGEQSPDFLKLTSGTTSAPRLVLFTHKQIIADCDQICETMGIFSSDRNYGVVSFSHSYGFSNLITPLIFRGVPLVVASDGIPRAVVSGLELSQASVFPGVPPLFNALLKLGAALPGSLRLLISAGAALPREVIRDFHARYGLKIHSFYGASECGGICYDGTEDAFPDSGFVGTPMKTVSLEKKTTVNPDEMQCIVRSAAVGICYFPEDDPVILGKGAFRPADLLKEGGNGYCISGRLSDLINVGGKKVNPADVESAIKKHPDVEECVVFGVSDEKKNEVIHACVVTKNSISEKDLRSACALSLSIWQLPHRIHFVDEIPQTARGKISRRELAKCFG